MLGFDEDLEDVPPLREIKQQFRKESLVRHPDKPKGGKEAFQELLDVFNKIVIIVRSRDEHESDEAENEDQEMLAKRYFTKYSLYGN